MSATSPDSDAIAASDPVASEPRTWSSLTSALIRGEDLAAADADWAMDRVLTGEATPVQLAGFL
ncbi:MAG: hypothetical protein F2911_09445, partial [Actinobacteria bacterium]|nr:hypothetical protein [Actinomycetota bacterium]